MRGRRSAIAPIVILLLTLAAAPAAAQGRGRKVGQGRGSPAAPSLTSSSSSVLESGVGQTVAIRQFGSWLDDASLLQPGQGWMALSLGHARAFGVHQTDFPIIEGAVGVTPELQVGGTVPYYRLHFEDGSSLRGFGDVYVNAKFSLLDPADAANTIGLAVSPLVEILSEPDPLTGGRLFWGAPFSVEFRASTFRLYGSGGYFSRGALFGSGAVEIPVTGRLILTGAVIQMRALNDDPAADALGLARNRLDVAGAAAYVLSPAVAVFGSVGRTVSGLDAAGTPLTLNAGLSITFAP